MHVTWKPLSAGTLNLTAGIFTVVCGFLMLNGNVMLTTFNAALGIPAQTGGYAMLTLGALGLLGGICSLSRRFWQIALTGSIANIIAPHGIMGLVATIFIFMSRKEFK